jgi:hypothetical protein
LLKKEQRMQHLIVQYLGEKTLSRVGGPFHSYIVQTQDFAMGKWPHHDTQTVNIFNPIKHEKVHQIREYAAS